MTATLSSIVKVLHEQLSAIGSGGGWLNSCSRASMSPGMSEAGATIEEIMDWFHVTREQVVTGRYEKI